MSDALLRLRLDGKPVQPVAVQTLAHQLLPSRSERISAASFIDLLQEHPVVLDELREICAILRERTSLARFTCQMRPPPGLWLCMVATAVLSC
jgi:hypothetical protein